MSLRPRNACLLALFVGCVGLQFVGCSDSGAKKVVRGTGEAGEAGEPAGGTSAGTAGTGTKPAGGEPGAAGAVSEGGASAASEAGQGGTAVTVGAAGASPSEAGAPNIVAEGGAAGAAPTGAAGAGPVCTPTGTVSGVSLQLDNQQTVCRGAIVTTGFNASGGSDPQFTCCGLSDTTTPYVVPLQGVTTSADGASRGNLALTVPSDAPIGAQSISATCTDGAVQNTFDIIVSEAAPPVVTELESSLIFSNSTLTIDGSNLSGVDSVTAVSADGTNSDAPCAIQDSSTDTSIDCTFDSGIDVGDYFVVVQQSQCGAATNQPGFTIEING